MASVLTIVFVLVNFSKAALEPLLWPTSAVKRTFKYVSKELFRSSSPKWYDLTLVLIVGNIGLDYFNYF